MVGHFDGFEISPIHEGDSWKICNFCIANSDRLKRFFPKTLEQNLTPSLSQIFVEQKVKAFASKQEFLFTLKKTETRELAGLIYLKELDWSKSQGEFAYCVGYIFKGSGLITKAIDLLTHYAFEVLNLKTLQIIAHKDNPSSINVAKKNDFKWIKTLEKAFAPPLEDALDMELYERYA